RSYPSSVLLDDATYAIADCYYSLGEYDKAIAQYKKVVDTYPGSELVADALTGLKWSMMQKGETAQADQVVAGYVERLPDREIAARVVERQAEYFRDNGQYPEAIAQYEKLLSGYSATAAGQSAWYGIARCQQAQGQPDQAIASFRQQWTRFPGAAAAPQALFTGAQMLAERGDKKEAAVWYARLSSEYPNHKLSSAAAYARGVLDIDADQPDQAIERFKALESEGKSAADRALARLGQARVLIGKKQYEEAQTLLEQLLGEGSPAISAEAQFLLASILQEQKEWSRASLAFVKIKYLYPEEEEWVAAGLYQAARCNEALGRLADARRLYQSLINDFPGRTDYVSKSRVRLDALAGK
ncbi:MAG TPA: tetratricopeptide repeat protein, partial [bacterium]|nr:tetratricopeptide repeat protein [bacterium]